MILFKKNFLHLLNKTEFLDKLNKKFQVFWKHIREDRIDLRITDMKM